MFKKVLIANRGEIALRIHRACKEMGLSTVAAHSTADANAMHVRLADEAICIGPPPSQQSYLNIPAIISACEITNADAVHPGYGFLSENAKFAEILEAHDITFIGPSPEHVKLMGDKVEARAAAQKLGLPLVPGSNGPVESESQAMEEADAIGYPVIIKAAAGGGGRGMMVAHTKKDLAQALARASKEAKAAFGDDTLYMEKYLIKPRHIEVQVIADKHGKGLTLGDRDCSLQRRHQKIFEEALAPGLKDRERNKIATTVEKAIQKIGYYGLGTVEFLYEDGNFYFIEMNTRVQVEHPVTEMITDLDLIQEQIAIAAGEPLNLTKKNITFRGHSVECRINAENPKTFIPSPGTINVFHPPGGPGVRVDSYAYSGCTITPHYDSLIGKLIITAPDREACLKRLQRAMSEFVIDGVQTTIPLFQALLKEESFRTGNYHIHWLDTFIAKYAAS